MATLEQLKTKYEAEIVAQEVEQQAKEQAAADELARRLAEFMPRAMALISEREGVDIAELETYGRVVGEWSNFNNRMENITFTLTLPEHKDIGFRFYQEGNGAIVLYHNNAPWVVEDVKCESLAAALFLAATLHRGEQERSIGARMKGITDPGKATNVEELRQIARNQIQVRIAELEGRIEALKSLALHIDGITDWTSYRNVTGDVIDNDDAEELTALQVLARYRQSMEEGHSF